MIVDVEVAQDRVTVEEDPDQDLDPEINREIDQEAALEEEADLEASPKIEVEAKRLLERRVVQDHDPNPEAGDYILGLFGKIGPLILLQKLFFVTL